MFNNGFGSNGDFEAVARQYWSAWGDAMRQAGLGGAAPPPASHWQQAVDWWTQLMPGGRSQANDAVGRFNQQASHWFGQMQQVAAQFAGQDSSAADVSQAWRRAMGANADHAFPDLFKAMRGQGAHGLDDWLEQVKPYLDGFQQQTRRWQQMPAFGQYREHQERWQALQLAQQEYQRHSEAFNALMVKCAQRAFEVFEDKLTAHEEPGRQITSARGLFDLWIDSAEEAYAGIALSHEFREVYGALGNAQMRLRAAIQLEVEHMSGLFGMPTRTEIDSAHRKIAELERSLRRAAAGNRPAAERKAAASPPAATELAAPPVEAKPRRMARKKAAKRKPPRKSTGKQSNPAKKVAARKVANKPAVVMQKSPVAKTSASKVAGKATASAKPKRKPAAAAKPARQASPQKKSPPSSNRVVSMKDWVARYAAMNTPQGPAAPVEGKKRARK